MFPPVVVPGQHIDELTPPTYVHAFVTNVLSSSPQTYTVPAGKVLAVHSYYLANGASGTVSISAGGITWSTVSASQSFMLADRNRRQPHTQGTGVGMSILSGYYAPSTTAPTTTTSGTHYVDTPYLFFLGPGTVITWSKSDAVNAGGGAIFGSLHDA